MGDEVWRELVDMRLCVRESLGCLWEMWCVGWWLGGRALLYWYVCVVMEELCVLQIMQAEKKGQALEIEDLKAETQQLEAELRAVQKSHR